MRTAHAAARTLACAFVTLAAVARADGAQGTLVHLDGASSRVTLQRVGTGDVVCTGSCDHTIAPGDYRVAGSNVSPSMPFVVDGARASYAVDVRPLTPKAYRTGRALAIAGGATMAMGALFGILALATINQGCGSSWFCIQPAPLFGAMAGIFGGVGLLVLIPGAALMSSASEPTPTVVNRVAGLALHGSF